MSVYFDITSQKELRRIIIDLVKLKKDVHYDAITFSVENTNLTKSFYNELVKFNTKELNIYFQFTGDCLNGHPKFPPNVERLTINSFLSFEKSAIDAICSCKNLTYLHISGYIPTYVSTINEILINCPKVSDLYVSYTH